MPKHIIGRLERLDHLIRTKATGTPTELAGKLGISRSCLFNYIGLLKELGAPLEFCRKRNCYYYREDGSLCIKFLHQS